MFWRQVVIYREAIGIALIIAYLSLACAPVLQSPSVEYSDKFGHMLAYMGFSALLTMDLLRGGVVKARLWLLGLLLPIIYGGFMEILQGLFFYPRTASLYDWAADSIGSFIGVGLVVGIWGWKN